MKYIYLCAVLFLHFVHSDAILCYQCDDSTDNKDIADCTYNVRTLGRHRNMLETGEFPITDLSYLKNCSNYINIYGEEQFMYCKIEVIQSFGSTNAYLRDCSDGTNFARLNVTRLRYPRPDNQTTCGFSQLQGATQCIQLCDGDFCNGPIAHGNQNSVSVTAVLITSLLDLMMNFYLLS